MNTESLEQIVKKQKIRGEKSQLSDKVLVS